jgi:hypothetical protein
MVLERQTLPAGWTELFASGIRLPHRVCIVAPGPNGIGAHRKIPPGYFVIAVSKAILIDGLAPGLWIMTHSSQDWFDAAERHCRCPRLFSSQALSERPSLLGGPDRFYFELEKEQLLAGGVLQSVEGCVRRGASVSSCAVQIAYNLGARNILLCGVDMSGDFYWDGSINLLRQHGETWTAVNGLNALIRFLNQQRNVSFATLSPTRLDVPSLMEAADHE